MLDIPLNLINEIIDHCRAVYPNEACGLCVGKKDSIEKVYRVTNIEKSSVRYLMDSREQLRIMKAVRNDSLEITAIYHSHPHSPAIPSETDIDRSLWDGYPVFRNVVHIIVSLSGEEPDIQAFSIDEKGVENIEISIRDSNG